MEWPMLLFCFLIYLSGNTVLWLDLLPGKKMNTFSSIWELASGRNSVGLLSSVWVPNAFLHSSDQLHFAYTEARRLPSSNIFRSNHVSYFTRFIFDSGWNQMFRCLSTVVDFFLCALCTIILSKTELANVWLLLAQMNAIFVGCTFFLIFPCGLSRISNIRGQTTHWVHIFSKSHEMCRGLQTGNRFLSFWFTSWFLFSRLTQKRTLHFLGSLNNILHESAISISSSSCPIQISFTTGFTSWTASM